MILLKLILHNEQMQISSEFEVEFDGNNADSCLSLKTSNTGLYTDSNTGSA